MASNALAILYGADADPALSEDAPSGIYRRTVAWGWNDVSAGTRP